MNLSSIIEKLAISFGKDKFFFGIAYRVLFLLKKNFRPLQ